MITATLAVSAVDAAPRGAKPSTRQARAVQPAKHSLDLDGSRPDRRGASPSSQPSAAGEGAAWARSLAAIEVVNRNTRARGKVRLYRDDGTLDRDAAESFMRISTSRDTLVRGEHDVPERLDLRLVQLAMRASYHFGGATIAIVSATRKGARGKHGTGEALDFALEGVRASTLARHLFGYPRAGVGIYTHPRTQYVHLDVRDRGTHWLDGSPPGVTWREKMLFDPKQAARDASYAPAKDLPESAD